MPRVRGETLFTAGIMLAVALATWEARNWDLPSSLFPWVIGFPLLGLLLAQLVTTLRTAAPPALDGARGTAPAVQQPLLDRESIPIIAWLLAFLALIWLLGFPLGGPLAALLYLRFGAGERWPLSLGLAASSGLFFWALRQWLTIPFPPGLVPELLSGGRL